MTRYCYDYQQPTLAKYLLAEFWMPEKEAKQMVGMLEKGGASR